MYIRSFGPLKDGQKFDEEGTGWGWTLKGKIASADTNVPTTCKMERP
jgi:branched-chain amino acid transport system substrate-binding protein